MIFPGRVCEMHRSRPAARGPHRCISQTRHGAWRDRPSNSQSSPDRIEFDDNAEAGLGAGLVEGMVRGISLDILEQKGTGRFVSFGTQLDGMVRMLAVG